VTSLSLAALANGAVVMLAASLFDPLLGLAAALGLALAGPRLASRGAGASSSAGALPLA
jgi:hypothetical protein